MGLKISNLWALAAVPIILLLSRIDLRMDASPALGILWLLPYTPGRALVDPYSHKQCRIPVFLISL